jgi:hypothetical protein
VLDSNVSLTVQVKLAGASGVVSDLINATSVSGFDLVQNWIDNPNLDYMKRMWYWWEYVMYLLQTLNHGYSRVNINGVTVWQSNYAFEFQIVFFDGANSYHTSMQDNVTPDLWDGTYPEDADATVNSSYNNYVIDMLANGTEGRGSLQLVWNTGVLSSSGPVNSVTLTGPFLKLLGLDPFKATTFTLNNTITGTTNGTPIISPAVPIDIITQNEYIAIRLRQCRNEIDCSRSQQELNFSDLLAIVPTCCRYINYEAQHSGSKLLVNGRVLDSFDLQFYDKWGSPLTGLRSFVCELTIDFVQIYG